MKSLNKADEVYNYIEKFILENNYSPSVREICRACGLKSTATAFDYINELCNRGLIKKAGQKNRAVVLKQQTAATNVPLIGTVAAGQPIFAAENYDGYFSLPSNYFYGDDLFMLNVSGNSMIKIGMYNGDKIIVKKQETADDGDIVVALVDDSATVKRLFRRDGKIILHPENDDMDDFVFDDVQIIGKVVGLMRTL
ncbi:MAG: transcriptional repressor LexA [Clostridia bacterium]|nr:transcriptional repressor LexA [Clostridia bacterium]